MANRQISQDVCAHSSPKIDQSNREEALWPRERAHGERLIELMGATQEEFSPLKELPVEC